MRLIDADALISALDERYNEKLGIVPDNLAEGFVQVEKLIKEQPTVYDADEVALAMEKQEPYKIIYKNGFGYCRCGCEFESEGYSGEEYCPECGQKVWVGGYNGEENKIVSFAEVKNETD